MPVTLASGSPQRSEILRKLGVEFEVVMPGVEELTGGDPEVEVVENARRKARAVERGGFVIACDTDVVLDGEVVAFAGSQTSFERLQQRGEHPVSVFYYVFDVLHLDGHDTTALPLRARKGVLRRALAFHGPVRFTQHRNRDGEELYGEACRKGWEGVIAKRAESPYTHGRARDWLKFKCSAEQELVIGGFTAPKGSRTDLGALLVGYYDGDKLRYAGKVGTGFTQATLRDLAGRLAPLTRDTSPFAEEVRERHVTWVQPALVGQVGFSEWTRDGRLRHPRFLGLRDDKAASEVVRESPR